MSAEQTWRVYLSEWLVAYVSDALGPDGQEECRQHFRYKYAGRVREQDWRSVPAVFGMELSRCPYDLQLFLPNLRAEFKDEADAEWLTGELLKDHGEDPQVVRRGSPEEKALLGYGERMLPAGADGGKGS